MKVDANFHSLLAYRGAQAAAASSRKRASRVSWRTRRRSPSAIASSWRAHAERDTQVSRARFALAIASSVSAIARSSRTTFLRAVSHGLPLRVGAAVPCASAAPANAARASAATQRRRTDAKLLTAR